MMSEKTREEIRNEIIKELRVGNDELIIDEENFHRLSDKLSEEDIQEFSDKMNELGISRLKIFNNKDTGEIQISAESDEFPDKDEGYKDTVVEMGEFLGFKCRLDDFERDKITLI